MSHYLFSQKSKWAPAKPALNEERSFESNVKYTGVTLCFVGVPIACIHNHLHIEIFPDFPDSMKY